MDEWWYTKRCNKKWVKLKVLIKREHGVDMELEGIEVDYMDESK